MKKNIDLYRTHYKRSYSIQICQNALFLNVGKVSSIFESFSSGFVFRHGLALLLGWVICRIKFCSKWYHFRLKSRAKNLLILQILTFWETFPKVFRVPISSLTWVASGRGPGLPDRKMKNRNFIIGIRKNSENLFCHFRKKSEDAY